MQKLIGWLEKKGLSLSALFLLIFIPLYPKFPLFSISGTYVKVRVDDLVVLATILVWIWCEARRGAKIFRSRLAQLILVYWLIGFFSLLNSLLVTKTVSPLLGLLHFLRRVQYMSLFFIGFRAWQQRRSWRPYLIGLAMVVVGVFVFGAGQKYFGWPVISTMNEEFSKGLILKLDVWTRISSTFAGHYDLAVFAVLAISLLWGIVLGGKFKKLRWGSLILVILSFYLLILTASRVSFGAYLVAIVFVLVWAKRYWLVAPVLVLSLMAMNLNTDLGQRYLATFKLEPNTFSQLQFWKSWRIGRSDVGSEPTPTPKKETGDMVTILPSGTSGEGEEPIILNPIPIYPPPEPAVVAAQRSNDIRFKVEWPRALRAFAKSPLLGTGYSSVTLATDSDYLRAIAETGLLGLVAFGLIFVEYGVQFVSFWRASAKSQRGLVVLGVTGGVVGMLANAAFIDVFEASKVAYLFWLLMGLAAATIEAELQTRRVNEK